MSYKNYKFEAVGSDYNSPFLRNYIWTKSFFNFPTVFKLSRSAMGIFCEGNKMKYLSDVSTWTKTHEELKARINKDNGYFEKLINKTNELGEAMNKWTERNLSKPNLGKLSNERLFKLLEKFVEKEALMYSYGILVPILDFQGFSFVESNLENFLKAKVPESKYAEYYQVFTEPIHNSFAQDQEEDLLKLMKRFYSPAWADDVKKLSRNEIKNKYPDFYEKLEKHAAKHAWVYYVYAGPAWSEEQFLDFLKDYLRKGINPAGKLKELAENRKRNQALKKRYLKELKPDKFSALILNLAGKVVWAKPRRKDYQSQSYYHSEKLLKEIGRRLSLSLAESLATPLEMIRNCLLNGARPDRLVVKSIQDAHACLPNDDGTTSVLMGEEAKKFGNSLMKETGQSDQQEIREIKGSPACRGLARGIVRIINIPEDMTKMNDGDILVSTATTPSVVPAMKKAAAIVTDEGGLTCHAAIVSRELKIPCVVGTKIATKILKDGDIVEVNANNGIVRIIKKAM